VDTAVAAGDASAVLVGVWAHADVLSNAAPAKAAIES